MLTKKEQRHCSELIKKVLTPPVKKKRDKYNFIPYDKTGNLYQYREMNKYEKEYVENRIKDAKKEQRTGCEYSEDYSCPKCGEELLVTCIHPLELYCTRCRENVELNEIIELNGLHKPEKHLKRMKI